MYPGSALSASRLKTFEDCVFKYFLTYEVYICENCKNFTYVTELLRLNILLDQLKCPVCSSEKLSRLPSSENWGARFGSVVHKVMELYAKSYLLNGNLNDRNWKNNLILALSSQIEDLGHINWNLAKQDEYANIVPNCNNCPHNVNSSCIITNEPIAKLSGCPLFLYNRAVSYIERYIKKYQNGFEHGLISVEQEFAFEVADGIKLTGFKDLVLKSENVLEIIDYKTGKHVPSYNALRESLQPQIYSIAAKKMYPGYDAYMLIFDFATTKPVTLTYTEQEDEANKNKIINMFHKIVMTKSLKRRPFDHYCRNLCDRATCDVIWDKIQKREK